MSDNVTTTDDGVEVHNAGAFDIRTFIGVLLGFFGVVITIMGLWFTTEADKSKVNGENLNLQVGIALIVVSVFFIAWALIRPLRVPAHIEDIEHDDRPPAH